MGFTLQEMQSWDQNGRKKSSGEQISAILKAVAEGAQKNKVQKQTNLLNDSKLRDAGYTSQDGGMASVLQNILAGGANYQYTGKPIDAKDAAQTALYKAQADYYANYKDKNKSDPQKEIENSIREKIANGIDLTPQDRQYFDAFMGSSLFRELPEPETAPETAPETPSGGMLNTLMEVLFNKANNPKKQNQPTDRDPLGIL